MKVFISGKARRELLQIYAYLAERNSAAAESVIQEVNRKLENLTHFPFIGRERPNISPGLRSLVVRNYVIFYDVAHDQITIYRVIDGRMDIDREFQR